MQAAAAEPRETDPAACASDSGSAESKAEDASEEKPEWCHRVQWELLPRTPEQVAWCSGSEDADKIVELPEAAKVSRGRRALVTLPSGAVMACMSSVLVKYCSALRDKRAELFTHVVHLSYQPKNSAYSWRDEAVLGFFSMLHKFNTDEQLMKRYVVIPAWSAIASALGVDAYVEHCQQKIQTELATKRESRWAGMSVDWTWKWIAAYRQFADEETWRRSCLSYFLPMKFDLFQLFWAAEHRPVIVEMFSGNDLFALAYSRWKYWAQGWLLNPTVLLGKCIYASSITPLQMLIVEYRESEGWFLLNSGAWRDLRKVEFKIDGRTYKPNNTPLLPCNLEWPRAHAQSGGSDERPRGEITLPNLELLEQSQQLKVVVDADLSFKCDYDIMEAECSLLAEDRAVIDKDGGMHTLQLPFVASPKRLNEVVKFFQMTHSRKGLPGAWKYTWVQLADVLQMDAWLEAVGRWVWGGIAFENFGEWVAISRLQTIQARKPNNARWNGKNTITAEDVLKLLQSMNDAQLMKVFSGDGDRFAELVELDALFDLFATKQCDPIFPLSSQNS